MIKNNGHDSCGSGYTGRLSMNEMILPILAIIGGLVVLLWSADLFVSGSSNTAHILGMPPLMIGMIIVGFGTSTPEMVVSALASTQGNPGIAMGNAYGSNIANIGLILGSTAIISPILVHSKVLRKELPFLTSITVLSIVLILDHELGQVDAVILLAIFAVFFGWSIHVGRSKTPDSLADQVAGSGGDKSISGLKKSLVSLVVGLALLILSSRALVWGAVDVARTLGVSDLIIGLTIVAVGTSLPELASSLTAVRKGENDIAIGNVIGSNIFNTMIVIGIAGSIEPIEVNDEVLLRDMSTMGILTVSLFIFGYGFRGRQGRINRFEGLLLLSSYIAYTAYLIWTTLRVSENESIQTACQFQFLNQVCI